MYNFSASLNDESGNDTREVDKLMESVNTLIREHQLPMFNTDKKNERTSTTSDDERNEGRSAHCWESNDGGVTEQLETCGYKVVPDVFEAEGGTWELLFKVQHNFSIHDIDCLLPCSHHPISAWYIDGVIRRRSN
jgi:hypothetical protein